MNDGAVRNAAVKRVCNQADAVSRASIGMFVSAGVALASTVVFGAFMIRGKLRSRGRVTVAPTLGPRVGYGVGVSGKF